jgi:PKD repeat protein
LNSRAATTLRLLAQMRFATAKTVVPVVVGGSLLLGSQLVMAAAPEADFSVSPQVPQPGQAAIFTVTANDPDGGSIDAIEWDWENDGTIDESGDGIQHSFGSPGLKSVRLVVTDSASESTTVVRQVRVNAPPSPAFDHSPQSPTAGQSVSFDASDTTDDAALADSGFSWDLDGDGDFGDATGRQVSQTYLTPGSRTVRLRVTDANDTSATTSQAVPVAAPNVAPSASFTFSPAVPLVGQTVSFDASGSTDDGPLPPTSYTWDLDGDGQYDDATGQQPSISYPTAGAKSVGLKVTDALGLTSTATRIVNVNAAPTAAFTFTPASPVAGKAVSFDAAGSTDDKAIPAGGYAWDFDNDGAYDDGTGAKPTFTFATAGAKTVGLQVTDSDGARDTETKTVTVTNKPPVADFKADPQTPRVGEAVKFDSAASSDPDDQAITRAWDLDGDGKFNEGANQTDGDGTFNEVAGLTATRSYSSAGDKIVRLRVTDSAGASTIKERHVLVQAVLPEASFTSSPAAPLPGEAVTFTSTSTASARAKITKTEWDLDGISGFERSGTTVSAAFVTAGPHTVTLQVTEDSGGVDVFSAEILVNAPPLASMTFSPSQPYVGDAVEFVSLARDPDGALASEQWDLDGDGQYDDGTGRVASRRFTTAGPHTVRLRVLDTRGAAAVTALSVGVLNRPAPPPPPRLDPTVHILSRPGRKSTVITRLTVKAQKGAMVRVSCKGRSCPKRKANSTRSRGRAVHLDWLERRLAPGTRITIYVTRKGRIGAYTSLVIRRGKRPLQRDGCLKPGSTRTMRCPA